MNLKKKAVSFAAVLAAAVTLLPTGNSFFGSSIAAPMTAYAASNAVGNLYVVVSGLNESVTVTVTGNGQTYTRRTDAKTGYAVFAQLPVYDTAGSLITYTIREDVPAGYLAAESMQITLTDGQTAVAGIPNIEKTYTVTVELTDSKTGTAVSVGDASLAGGVYAVRRNGKLYGTYTSAADGSLCSFTLTGTDYTGDWTIQQISAPTGYFYDPIERSLDEVTACFPDYTGAVMRLQATPITGTLSITAAAGDEMEVYLQSAGSYEACAENARAQYTASGAASNHVSNLPYGTYVISNLTTGESTTASIQTYLQIVSVDLTSDLQEQYILYPYGQTTPIASGSVNQDGALALPDDFSFSDTELHYYTLYRQYGTAETESDICLYPDGSYTKLESALYGDANLDGRISLADAVTCSKYFAGTIAFSPSQKLNADCCMDALVDDQDLKQLVWFLLKITDRLPVKSR